MRGSDFIFYYVYFLHYKCLKTSFKQEGSYIDSPDWIKNKKATINAINKKDNKCFKYAVTVVLILEEIKNYPKRTTKIKPFINKNNCQGIN